MPLPPPKRFVLNADSGGGGEEDPERDISGMVAVRAVELQVEMNEGKVLIITPDLPPRSLRRRFDWLHGLRFFDVFFSASQRPELVTAFDQSGHVLGRSKAIVAFSSSSDACSPRSFAWDQGCALAADRGPRRRARFQPAFRLRTGYE